MNSDPKATCEQSELCCYSNHEWRDFSGSPSLTREQAQCAESDVQLVETEGKLCCVFYDYMCEQMYVEVDVTFASLYSHPPVIPDIDARPWDFQAEECALRESIEKFNSRRYDRNRNGDFAPVDNCLQSVLGQRVELPEDFHYSYEMWLEREVFSQPIQWEGLLQNP